MTKALAYTTRITERVRYTFELLFKDLLGIDLALSTDREEFLAFDGPKVNYTKERSDQGVWIPPVELLFENEIREFEPDVSEWEGRKVLFKLDEPEASFPFDLFAASFYLTVRYEEYLPFKADRYGRFPARESLAYEHGFLREPVVDRWALQLRDALLEQHPESSFPERKYRFRSSIDVDSAFAYKDKGLIRNLGGYLRALIQFDLKGIGKRTMVLSRLQKDPFDTFRYQWEVQKKYGVETLYFFLLADHGPKDKNVPVPRTSMHSLIQETAARAEIGAHPSFASNGSPEKLPVEIERLRSISGQKVTRSRQHYLMLRMPDTYRRLLENGIEEDYSMGFASEPGFRAGTASSFPFFDLERNLRTELRVHPFAVMDSGLRFYKDHTPEEALESIGEMKRKVEEVGGTFISVWHNESMSEWEDWKGWGELYEEMIKIASTR